MDDAFQVSDTDKGPLHLKVTMRLVSGELLKEAFPFRKDEHLRVGFFFHLAALTLGEDGMNITATSS